MGRMAHAKSMLGAPMDLLRGGKDAWRLEEGVTLQNILPVAGPVCPSPPRLSPVAGEIDFGDNPWCATQVPRLVYC